jgi:hypothetical protein
VAISDCTGKPLSGVYRPRHPESSPLYHLEEHFAHFLLLYEEQFERHYGPLRSVVKRTVSRFLECGILEYGLERIDPCPDQYR